jgi:hypothetical protein
MCNGHVVEMPKGFRVGCRLLFRNRIVYGLP